MQGVIGDSESALSITEISFPLFVSAVFFMKKKRIKIEFRSFLSGNLPHRLHHDSHQPQNEQNYL